MASGSNVTLNVGANLNPTNLVRQLNQVQAKYGTFNMTLNTKGFRQPLGRITGDLGEFQNALDASIARTLAFGAAVGVVNGVANAFKAMVSSAIDVEKKLADINVILNESQKGLADFSNKLFEVAKNTGQSFDAVSDAAVELARQGLGAEETLKRINDAMVLTRLSGMDAAKSVETLTAAVNGFGQSALTTTQLVNKLATVDAAFAVSTEDLANALARAGSSAQAAKVDLDQLLAAVTSVQQQTARGGAVIGNAFKSIFTRIQRSGVREALEEIGVATTDAAGNIRGALDILKDYAGVYGSLTDQQRAYTDELVAGVFQINNLKALIKDLGSGFSIYDRALSQSANATDEATRRNKALGETLASLVNEAAVNVKALAASLGNLVATPAIQNLLNLFNSISEALVKALDPEKGSKLIQGMFKGIGNFIAGPGLLIVGAAFVKLFKFITGQSVRALKEVFKINTAAQKTKQIEAELSAILANNKQLYQQISNQSLTRQQREQMVLNAINAETAAYKAQAVIVAQLAKSRSVIGGIGARTRAGGGRSSANGFVPNYVNEVEGAVASERAAISAGVGGASKGAQAKVLPGFPVGGGRKETMVANTDEVIAPNFGGGQGSAIFNPDMIKSMGMPDGAIPVARGFVPNFAQQDKGLKKIGTTSSREQISVDVSPYGVLFGIGPRGPKEKFKVNIAQQFSKEDLKSERVSTNPQTNLLDYINYKTQGGSRIFLRGMPQGSLTPSGGADWESAEPAFREQYVAPAASAALKTMSNEIFKNVFDDEARGMLEKMKIPAGAVSTSVEGGLFEQAINVGTAAMLGVEDFKSGGGERSRWDFDEDGMINPQLKNIFFPNDSGLKKADAKRSPEKSVWGSMASKVFSEERMKEEALAMMVSKAKEVAPTSKTSKGRGRGRAHGFIPNFAQGGVSGSVDAAIKSATDAKKATEKLNLDFGELVVDIKELKRSSSAENLINAGSSQIGIRGASGFIPSFASALEESITREKDALAAQGSDAKVYTGQDDRLKGPKNPAGLLVANTRDEPRSGSQGVDRMLSAGRNPKTSGAAEGYVPNFVLPVLAAGGRVLAPLLKNMHALKAGAKATGKSIKGTGEKMGGLMDKMGSLSLILFGLESVTALLNPVLEQFGISIPSLTEMFMKLSDSFKGVNRGLVETAEKFKKTKDDEIKALSQSIEKVDSFTGSVNKLSNSIEAGNVESIGDFLGEVLEKSKDLEGMDLGGVFQALGDPQGMQAAASAAKEAAEQAKGVKVLESDLASLSAVFQEMSQSERSLEKALEETKITMKSLSGSLLSGKDAEGLEKVVESLQGIDDPMQALSATFPNLSREAWTFIATTDGLGKKLVEVAKDQATYSLAIKNLQAAVATSVGGGGVIKKFGDDLVKMGEQMNRGATAAAAALDTLNATGEIAAKSRVEGLKATGTVGSADLLKGLAGADLIKNQKKSAELQKRVLEDFASSMLKESGDLGTVLEGPLAALVKGINEGTSTAEISLGLLKDVSEGTGDNAKAAKDSIEKLSKINRTQIDTARKTEALLQANLQKLERQAVSFQRNNILSEQQIKGFSEFRNELQKDGETQKTQLQRLGDLNNVMSTIESLTGDDAVLAEMREQTKQLTQLEGLRSVFNELTKETGKEFTSQTISGLKEEVDNFVQNGAFDELSERTKTLFLALEKGLDVAKRLQGSGVASASDIERAAGIGTDQGELNALAEQMSAAIGEGTAEFLGVNTDLINQLNNSLETNVSSIAESVARQAEDNEKTNAENVRIREETNRILADSLSGLNLNGAGSNLSQAADALNDAATALLNRAGGFVPNFAPTDQVSRAVNTERAFGGKPVVDYQRGVGTYVRDGKTQKNFSDVRRDHPEGIGRAIKNSQSMQGAGKGFVPAFASGILGLMQRKSGQGSALKKTARFFTPDFLQGALDGTLPGETDEDIAEEGRASLGEITRTYASRVQFPSFTKLFNDNARGGGVNVETTTGGVEKGPYYKIAGMPRSISSQKDESLGSFGWWLANWTLSREGKEKLGPQGTIGSFLYGVNQPTDGVVSNAKDLGKKLGELKRPTQLVPTPQGEGQAFFENIRKGGFSGEVGGYPFSYTRRGNPYSDPAVSYQKFLDIMANGTADQFYKFPIIKGNQRFVDSNLKNIDDSYGALFDDKWYRLITEFAARNAAASTNFLEEFGPIGSEGNPAGFFSKAPKSRKNVLGEIYKNEITKAQEIVKANYPDMEIPIGNDAQWNLARQYNKLQEYNVTALGVAHSKPLDLNFIKALGPEMAARKLLSDQAHSFSTELAQGGRGFLLPLSEFYPTEKGFSVGNDMTEWTQGDLMEGYEWLQKAEAHLSDRISRMPSFGFDAPDENKMERQLLNQRRDEVRRVAGELAKYAAPYKDVASRSVDSGASAYEYWLSRPGENLGEWIAGEQGGMPRQDIEMPSLAAKFRGLSVPRSEPWDTGKETKKAFDERLGQINYTEIFNKFKADRFAPLGRLKAAAATWGGRGARSEGAAEILQNLRIQAEEESFPTDDEAMPAPDALDPSVIGQIESGLELPPIPPPTTEQKARTEADKVRDNVYRALLQKPALPIQGAGSTAMSKEAIERALKYKNEIWPAERAKVERRFQALQTRYRDPAWGDTPEANRQLALIKKQMDALKKQREIYRDEDNALAFLYSGGLGGLEEWEAYNGETFDTPDSSYRKMLLKYFNGGPISEEFLNTNDDRNLSPEQYLEGFSSLGVKNEGNNMAKLLDYAKVRGFGGGVDGLTGDPIRALFSSLKKNKNRSGMLTQDTIGGGFGGGLKESDSIETLLQKYGGEELAKEIKLMEEGDLAEASFHKIKNAIKSGNNPMSEFIIDNMNPVGFWKSPLAKTIKGRGLLGGIPIWNLSNLAKGTVHLNRKDGQRFDLEALPSQDQAGFATIGKFLVEKRWEEKNKRWLDELGDQTLLDKALSRTSKGEAEQFAPYVASLKSDSVQTLFREILGDPPENSEGWTLKYGDAKKKFKKLKESSGQTDYGVFTPQKNSSGEPLTEELKQAGIGAVGSIDQGVNRKMDNLLFGDQQNPFPYEFAEGKPATNIRGAQAHLLAMIEAGTENDMPYYAPFGYKSRGSRSPSGTPEMVGPWLRSIGFNGASQAGAAKGFVPNFSAIAGEIAASRDAGYKTPVTAGQVKTMNIPGVGKTAYNTQESVFRKPGVSQPFIAPPSNSKAASGYKKAVQSKFHFDPYGSAASGFVPNFAGLDLSVIEKGFEKIFEAATMFENQSRSIEEAAKLLSDGATDLGNHYAKDIAPLTAETRKLKESMSSLIIPASIEVETGTLGDELNSLTDALSAVSGTVTLDVDFPDVSVNVNALGAVADIQGAVTSAMVTAIPSLVMEAMASEEIKNQISTLINQNLGLNG